MSQLKRYNGAENFTGVNQGAKNAKVFIFSWPQRESATKGNHHAIRAIFGHWPKFGIEFEI